MKLPTAVPTTLGGAWRLLLQVINGQLGFGDGTNPDNFSACFISATFTNPNMDTTFNHTLGRTPKGYIVTAANESANVWTGSSPATSTQITLQANSAGATLQLLLF